MKTHRNSATGASLGTRLGAYESSDTGEIDTLIFIDNCEQFSLILVRFSAEFSGISQPIYDISVVELGLTGVVLSKTAARVQGYHTLVTMELTFELLASQFITHPTIPFLGHFVVWVCHTHFQ